jgi:lysophospholipase L1-like esterase
MSHPPILINGVRDRNPVLVLRHISNLRVIAMGDSSVFGVGDQGDAIPSVGAGWAGRVAHDLGVARFLNVAKNGARARPIVKHQLNAAVAFNTHLVLMCIGTNDVLRGDFSKEEIRSSLTEVIEQLRESKSVLVLLGLPDPIKTAPGPLSLRKILATRVQVVNSVLMELAADHNLVFVPTWHSRIAHERRMWHVDRMHPSALGHQHIADLVRRHLSLPRRSKKKLPTQSTSSRTFELYWLITNGAKWFAKRSIDLVPGLIWLMISERIKPTKF